MTLVGTSLGALALALGGCAASGEGDPLAAGTEDIRGDVTFATAFHEATMINSYGATTTTNDDIVGRCSGALVAPRAVLTAGHCMQERDGLLRREVVVPYANGDGGESGGATARVAGKFSNYVGIPSTGGHIRIDFDQLDLGVFFLDRPVCIAQYPVLSAAPVPNGSQMVTVGRMNNGSRAGDFDLFVSLPTFPRIFGNPFYYEVPNRTTGGSNIAEGGDSGGPNYLTGPQGFATDQIISVTSSGGSAISFSSSRLDVPAAQAVKDAIAANGRLAGDCGQ